MSLQETPGKSGDEPFLTAERRNVDNGYDTFSKGEKKNCHLRSLRNKTNTAVTNMRKKRTVSSYLLDVTY